MTSRSSTAAPILAVLAIVLVTLGAYVGGYFWLSQRIDLAPNAFVRDYNNAWLNTAFRPAARIESWLCGVSVYSGLTDDDGHALPQ